MKRQKTISLAAGEPVYQLEPGGEPATQLQWNDTSSLVGDVLGAGLAESAGRMLVRWRTADGTLHERPLPVVRGLVVETGDLVLLQRPGNWHEWLITHVIEGHRCENSTRPRSVLTAGDKRIEINGEDELVLRCGEASITLRRNGRVVIRGAYVETRSKGVNRIKGGVVLIN